MDSIDRNARPCRPNLPPWYTMDGQARTFNPRVETLWYKRIGAPMPDLPSGRRRGGRPYLGSRGGRCVDPHPGRTLSRGGARGARPVRGHPPPPPNGLNPFDQTISFPRTSSQWSETFRSYSFSPSGRGAVFRGADAPSVA